jgi:hypothetical protein
MQTLQQTATRERRQCRARHDVSLVAYDINHFCDAHCIGRSLLYKLWREGRGPKYFLAGSERRITVEAAAAWRAEMEAATARALTEKSNKDAA